MLPAAHRNLRPSGELSQGRWPAAISGGGAAEHRKARVACRERRLLDHAPLRILVSTADLDPLGLSSGPFLRGRIVRGLLRQGSLGQSPNEGVAHGKADTFGASGPHSRRAPALARKPTWVLPNRTVQACRSGARPANTTQDAHPCGSRPFVRRRMPCVGGGEDLQPAGECTRTTAGSSPLKRRAPAARPAALPWSAARRQCRCHCGSCPSCPLRGLPEDGGRLPGLRGLLRGRPLSRKTRCLTSASSACFNRCNHSSPQCVRLGGLPPPPARARATSGRFGPCPSGSASPTEPARSERRWPVVAARTPCGGNSRRGGTDPGTTPIRWPPTAVASASSGDSRARCARERGMRRPPAHRARLGHPMRLRWRSQRPV